MKSNKKSTKNSKVLAKSFAVGTKPGQVFASVPYTSEDFKNSLLIVSLVANVFILTVWVTLQVSDEAASTIAQTLVR